MSQMELDHLISGAKAMEIKIDRFDGVSGASHNVIS
jgi:hypothetical protein